MYINPDGTASAIATHVLDEIATVDASAPTEVAARVALALLFNVAAVFGAIVEFHAGEGLLIGSASAGGVAPTIEFPITAG